MHKINRTHYCTALTTSLIDTPVSLAGWVDTRRDHGGLIFIDLRDHTGIAQLVFNPDISKEALEQAHSLRNEFVIAVQGTVIPRAAGTVNEKLATGAIEIQVKHLTILARAKALPFQLSEAHTVDEETRLRYRYLDIRRPEMHAKIKMRHKIIFSIREFLNKNEFYEVETPLLSKSTPEGARDFLVPSRLSAGNFYALPQSPQMYKQLLMASGINRYFQVAKCFRDEDLRANRQPEFTQLDLEMSFADESHIQDIIEKIVQKLWKEVKNIDVALPLRRMKFSEAFEKYGSDKPDTRFDLKIVELTSLFTNTTLSFLKAALDAGGKVGALHVQNKIFTRSELDSLVNIVTKELGGKGLLYVRFKEDGEPDSPVAKFLPSDFFKQVRELIPTLRESDTLFFVAGSYEYAWDILGKLRIRLGKMLSLIDESRYDFLWVTDFPEFAWDEERKGWTFVHHPFTQPQTGWESQEVGSVLARAYDIVCNGEELGGGSIRVHDSREQMKIFELLGFSKERAEEQFGFLLEAQSLGFPPHGGIALGVDRLVSILAGTDSIRDVIAFPKTQSGTCPLMQTPSQVSKEQLKELHIQISPLKTKKE
jgi:aspartyl-tRNA synthetase